VNGEWKKLNTRRRSSMKKVSVVVCLGKLSISGEARGKRREASGYCSGKRQEASKRREASAYSHASMPSQHEE
jgi:hypothetical protein